MFNHFIKHETSHKAECLRVTFISRIHCAKYKISSNQYNINTQLTIQSENQNKAPLFAHPHVEEWKFYSSKIKNIKCLLFKNPLYYAK